MEYNDILKAAERCSCRTMLDALELVLRQKAENEELNHKYELAVAEREANIKGFTEQLSKIKAEAITEFAERLCEDRVSNDPVVIAVKTELKMMKGGGSDA